MMTVDIESYEYNNMARMAQNVLLDYDCLDFPLDVFALAKKIGMNIIPYSSLSAKKYEQLAYITGTDRGFTVAYRKKNRMNTIFDTYYNDVNMVNTACRFTIAHEIKHVVNGDYLKKELTERDELLADYFAKCLLAPQAIIINSKLQSYVEYVNRFNLSNQAAEIWFSAVENRKSKFGASYLFSYEQAFLEQIEQKKLN